jgi:hypothetical protein
MEFYREISSVEIPLIDVVGRRRDPDHGKIGELAESISINGLLNPIWVSCVRNENNETVRYRLIAGLHRVAAVKRLRQDRIDARVCDCTEIEARLAEITENLHRTELTALERSEHVAEWIRLTEASQVSAQVDPKPQGGRPEGGVNAAARELGVERKQAHRAVKIDGLTDEAKEAARAAGLADNQSALLKIASYADKDQVEAVVDIIAEKAKAKAAHKAAVASVADKYIGRNGAAPVLETRLGLLSAWSAASEDERAAFMREIGLVAVYDDAIVAALRPDQLRAAALLYKRNAEQARRQARDPQEVERIKAADRARQSRRYAQNTGSPAATR